MAESKLLMLKSWFEIVSKTMPTEDAARVIYALNYYSCYDEKLDLGKEFGEDVSARLTTVVESYYAQIDRMNKKPIAAGGRKEKYDAEAISNLASQGKTVKEICDELGIEYSRGIYNTKGYKEGHAKWLKIKEAYGGQDPRTYF